MCVRCDLVALFFSLCVFFFFSFVWHSTHGTNLIVYVIIVLFGASIEHRHEYFRWQLYLAAAWINNLIVFILLFDRIGCLRTTKMIWKSCFSVWNKLRVLIKLRMSMKLYSHLLYSIKWHNFSSILHFTFNEADSIFSINTERVSFTSRTLCWVKKV